MPRPESVQAGQKYGRLTVVGFHDKTKASKRRYLCRCECGTETVVVGSNLRSGNAQSCGCLHREKAAASATASAKVPIVAGARFGMLTIVEKANASGRARWTCRCDCGTVIATEAASLRNGRTSSCGCLRREVARERGRANRVHGHADTWNPTPAYYTWRNMIARCENTEHRSYPDYGGRGITVCLEWRSSFEQFLADMGEPPEGRSIDRIDNEAGYSKANCRWATPQEQRANQRPRKGGTSKEAVQADGTT